MSRLSDSNADIVVIGAGAAGIASTQYLLDQGDSVALLEKTNRVGGRAWTDHDTFGVPHDVGAHWLHYGQSNFFCDYGIEHGFDIYPDNQKIRIFSAGNRKNELNLDFDELMNQMNRVYESSVVKDKDISLSEAARHMDKPWLDYEKFVLGPWLLGKEFAEISVRDIAHMEESEDYFCKEGYGTLVAHHARNLPVSLNTTVKKIDWSGRGVRVETNRGTMQTQAVIITVSTGVLSAGSIHFLPALPIIKQESFNRISMGCYEHITLQFSECDFMHKKDSYILNIADEPIDCFGVLVNASGSGLCYFDVGGKVGRNLLRENEDYRVHFALDKLVSLMGSDLKKSFVKGSATSWGLDENTRGSYASAEPGAFKLRSTLREPVANRIFFAGEACHPTKWASVAGAYSSGKETAELVSRTVNSK